jgi:hypothetical protein
MREREKEYDFNSGLVDLSEEITVRQERKRE